MRVSFVLLLITAFAAVACHDATSPSGRLERGIYAIQVPLKAAVTDTIRISFEDDVGYCDTGAVVESQMITAGVRFVVSSIASTAFCPPGIYITSAYIYTVVPPHPAPFTVSFAEPGEADSVRVVAAP
jgi:hypothetical protein